MVSKDSHIHLLEHLDGSELTSYTGHTNKPFGFDDLGVEAAACDVHSLSFSMLFRSPKTHEIVSSSYIVPYALACATLCNMRHCRVVSDFIEASQSSECTGSDGLLHC